MSQRSVTGLRATMCHVDEVNTLILDLFSRSAATIAGLFLFIATTVSLLRTIVVPRSLTSIISDAIAGSVTRTHQLIANTRKTYKGRDAVLAWNGPMIIVGQLLSWILLYFISYGLWIFGIGGVNIGDAFRQAGSSLFTLGFADSTDAGPTILAFMAAATGPIVIALLIGFLPTIYGSYIDREVNVSLLGVSGGEPSWGPEFLARLTLNDQLTDASTRFSSWTQWLGNLRLTHITYPVLLRIRSASPYRHWAVATLAIMDAASLQLALTKTQPRAQASEVIIHGTQTFETLYAALFIKQRLRNRIPFVGRYFGTPNIEKSKMERMPGYLPGRVAFEMAATSDSTRHYSQKAINQIRTGENQGIQLPRAEFDKAYSMLKDAGYPIEVDPDVAWEQFSISRVRYEFTGYQICEALDAVPAPWTGDRHKPTPVLWPASVVEILHDHVDEQDADSPTRPADSPTRPAESPDGSSAPPEPDAQRH